MRRPAREAGTILPLAVAAMLVLFSVLAFSVDQAVAYAAKARQENVLDEMRASCMEPSTALEARGSSDPGSVIASRAVEAARSEGFEGSVRVWFYEVPEAQVAQARRVWGIGLQIEEDVPTVLARGFGIPSISAASHRTVVAEPYAGERVWRPDRTPCGRFEVGPRQDQKMFYQMGSIDEFPDEMAREIAAALGR